MVSSQSRYEYLGKRVKSPSPIPRTAPSLLYWSRELYCTLLYLLYPRAAADRVRQLKILKCPRQAHGRHGSSVAEGLAGRIID